MYDIFLLVLIGAATASINRSRGIIAAVVAVATFSLIHIQDGIAQLGQRDLLIAALLLAGYAMLFEAQMHPRRGFLYFLSFLSIGLTLTITPTFLLLGLSLLILSGWDRDRTGRSLSRHFLYGGAGLVLPSFCALVWMRWLDVLPEFWRVATTLIPLHASLGRRPIAYLIVHAVSPIFLIVALWIVVVVLLRPRMSLERIELLLGAGFGFLAYVVQGKGYPYHRYPLLALLLVLMNMDFVEAVAKLGSCRMIAVAALTVECLVFAPRAAWLARSFSIETPFETELGLQLGRFGPQLSGKVQCLDTFGGCINTLYNLRLVQSTGYLYDCYLFNSHQDEISSQYRQSFWIAYKTARPDVIVVTDQFCFGQEGGFAKLENWPLLRDELASRYSKKSEWHSSTMQRWWSRSEFPPGFRIYVRTP